MNELPAMTQRLIDLFQGPLRDVRFPDADAERLEAVVDAARAAAAAVAHAEAALAAAREALADRGRAVVHETDRALAYVRVYAAARPDLQAELDALGTPPARRRPGRPRKARAPVASVETAAAE